MSEKERLAEVAALHAERKRKADELAAIDRRIDAVLFPDSGTKRKKQSHTGQEWERRMGASNERIAEGRRALAG